jgi:outer membrane biosynthesis protein TonB
MSKLESRIRLILLIVMILMLGGLLGYFFLHEGTHRIVRNELKTCQQAFQLVEVGEKHTKAAILSEERVRVAKERIKETDQLIACFEQLKYCGAKPKPKWKPKPKPKPKPKRKPKPKPKPDPKLIWSKKKQDKKK